MTVVLDRPYEFVPPHRGTWWPWMLKSLGVVDWYLRSREGVVGYECRGEEHWKKSIDQGKGVMLAPNHCRYADPVVLGWPSRDLGVHLYAMASWHLFNESAFDTFAIRRMGAFSINREGSDRQSLEMAIDVLVKAERSLILFPEGTTNRTNDVLKPLLSGVAFIARAAARKRAKEDGGDVVIHPVAMKYLCVGEIKTWAEQQLTKLERRFGWKRPHSGSILDRTVRVAEGLMSLQEIQYLGRVGSGSLPDRRDHLMEQLLQSAQSELGIDAETIPDESTEKRVRAQVRSIRSAVVAKSFDPNDHSHSQDELQHIAYTADLAQYLLAFPDCYLTRDETTDTRIVETIQRMQEIFDNQPNMDVPVKVVIEFGEAIPVPAAKAPKGEDDPVLVQLQQRLQGMLAKLSGEARPAAQAGLIESLA